MKESFVGLSGVISCPPYQALLVKSIQSDAMDMNATDILVTLSGINGTFHEFNAMVPFVGELQFEYSEDIHVSSVGTGLNTIIINYIAVGDQTRFIEMDGRHCNQLARGKGWQEDN